MARRRWRCGVAAALVLAALGACQNGPSSAERAACRAASRLLAANDRDTLRGLVDTMRTESGASGNDDLREAARDYERALDDQEEGAAADAIGRFYAACERLGLETPGGPAG